MIESRADKKGPEYGSTRIRNGCENRNHTRALS